MADPKAPKTADPEAAGPTAEQIAKAFGLKPEDVLACRDYGAYVVVVTKDGRKLDSRQRAEG